jgi:hypothetical protein
MRFITGLFAGFSFAEPNPQVSFIALLICISLIAARLLYKPNI